MWFFVTVLVLLATDAWAQTPCPRAPSAPRLVFEAKNAPTTYDNSRDIYAMRDAVRLGYVVAGEHDQMLGLTASRLNYSMNGTTWVLAVQKAYCVSLNEVKVTFGFEAMDVLIAKEYAPDSCAYQAILEHENEHVAINRRTMAEFLTKIKREYELQLKQLPPLIARSAKAGPNEALQRLQDAVEPVLQDMQRVLAHRNAQIDTHMSYSAVFKKCENWKPGAQPQ
jgi:hypothetical protein